MARLVVLAPVLEALAGALAADRATALRGANAWRPVAAAGATRRAELPLATADLLLL
jgi:hypothetical protein